MEFTYDDFLAHYYGKSSMKPIMPLEPWKCVDYSRFPLKEGEIERNTQKTLKALGLRMGGEYFERFKRVQTLSQEYGKMVFPAYDFLFLDVVCEDWLSLVDFHKDFRRDHSVHQPLTAYIVCKILGGGKTADAFFIGGQSLLDKALDVIINAAEAQYLRDRLKVYDSTTPLLKGNRDLWRLVFYQTAIITAMYHDLGYPWQFIEQMHSYLKDDIMLPGRLRYDKSVVNPQVKEYIENHKNELMFRPFYNYGKGGLTTDSINDKLFEQFLHESHGVPGALAYWLYNDEYNKTSTEPTLGLIKFCQEWSSLAILMHDMQKAYAQAESGFARLDFRTDPLSFIIALADTLEDFNRPNALFYIDDKTPKGCRIEYCFPSLSVELEENAGVAELRYKIIENEKTSQEFYKNEDQIKLFGEQGFFDLSSVGLSSMSVKCY